MGQQLGIISGRHQGSVGSSEAMAPMMMELLPGSSGLKRVKTVTLGEVEIYGEEEGPVPKLK